MDALSRTSVTLLTRSARGFGMLQERVYDSFCRLRTRGKAVFIRVWLGRGLHPDTQGYAQTRGHARGARFWVANEVQAVMLESTLTSAYTSAYGAVHAWRRLFRVASRLLAARRR